MNKYNKNIFFNKSEKAQIRKKHIVTDVNDPQYKTFFPSFSSERIRRINTSPIQKQPSFIDKCSSNNSDIDKNDNDKSNAVDISNWYIACKTNNNTTIINENNDTDDDDSTNCSHIIQNLCHLHERHKANEKSYLGDELYDRIYLINGHNESTYANYDSDTEYNSEDDNNLSELDFDN